VPCVTPSLAVTTVAERRCVVAGASCAVTIGPPAACPAPA